MFTPPLMLISPADLCSVRLECPACHSAVSLRLDVAAVPPLPRTCMRCGARWAENEPTDPAGALETFLNALGQWLKASATRQGGPIVTFEMSPMGHGHRPPSPPRPM